MDDGKITDHFDSAVSSRSTATHTSYQQGSASILYLHVNNAAPPGMPYPHDLICFFSLADRMTEKTNQIGSI